MNMAHASAPADRSHQRPSEAYLSSLIRWLQVKKYQYEVTFSLYMLTPTEKFIFSMLAHLSFPSSCQPRPRNLAQLMNAHRSAIDFVLFVLVSMLVAAASMYLPDHVVVMYRRIWYYVHGEIAGITKSSGGSVGDVVKTAVHGVGGSGGTDMVTATSRAWGEL